MVGASSNPLRPSYTVFSYLRRQPGYNVVPINPTIHDIDGVEAFSSLAAYAAGARCARRRRRLSPAGGVVAVVNESISTGARAIWFQYGVVNDEAISLADAAGMDVVVDRCMKVELARFRGGLSRPG